MKVRIVFTALLCAWLVVPAQADIDEQPQQHLPRTALYEVLDFVSKNSNVEFLVDKRVDSGLVVGPIDVRKMDYETLLLVLRNNGMAAIRSESVVSIVRVAAVRQYPLPVLRDESDAYAAEEWVTMLIELENAGARELVPILRPLLPQAGHLVGDIRSNTLTIVDRYGNVQRLLEVIRQIDARVTPQQPPS